MSANGRIILRHFFESPYIAFDLKLSNINKNKILFLNYTEIELVEVTLTCSCQSRLFCFYVEPTALPMTSVLILRAGNDHLVRVVIIFGASEIHK